MSGCTPATEVMDSGVMNGSTRPMISWKQRFGGREAIESGVPAVVVGTRRARQRKPWGSISISMDLCQATPDGTAMVKPVVRETRP